MKSPEFAYDIAGFDISKITNVESKVMGCEKSQKSASLTFWFTLPVA
jgi:hypothetical protein